jgi:hypothetical protein
MKSSYINRRNLVAFFLIFIGLFFIILNAVLSRQLLAQVTSNYREDIPIYSVDTEEKSVPSPLTVHGELMIYHDYWIYSTSTRPRPLFYCGCVG